MDLLRWAAQHTHMWRVPRSNINRIGTNPSPHPNKEFRAAAIDSWSATEALPASKKGELLQAPKYWRLGRSSEAHKKCNRIFINCSRHGRQLFCFLHDRCKVCMRGGRQPAREACRGARRPRRWQKRPVRASE